MDKMRLNKITAKVFDLLDSRCKFDWVSPLSHQDGSFKFDQIDVHRA